MRQSRGVERVQVLSVALEAKAGERIEIDHVARGSFRLDALRGVANWRPGG
jgi:hypothetical protein